MNHPGSKTRNLFNNGDNLNLRDVRHDESALYNRVIDDIIDERSLDKDSLLSPPDNKNILLEEMANQFDKQKAEEAVRQRKELNYVEQNSDDELAKTIDSYGILKRNFQNERAQEIFERILNNELLNIEELSLLADANTEGLFANFVNSDEGKIKIIHVFGYPLKFLKSLIGEPAISDLSLWEKNEQDLHIEPGQKRSGKEANSSILCTTYIDTDSNINMSRNRGFGLTYIFSKVKPDSVIKIGTDDVWSRANDGEGRPQIIEGGQGFLTPKELAEKSEVGGLNEVTLRRYDESGEPLLPDAILLTGGKGSEELNSTTLKHAAHFEIPIIHLDLRFYTDEYGNAPDETIINEINEDIDAGKDIDDIVRDNDAGAVGKYIGLLLQQGASKEVIKEKLESDGKEYWRNKLLLYGIT